MSFTARLLAYTPAGARLNDMLLDGVSWDAQMPLNDVAALSLSYPAIVDEIGLASEPVELAVEVSSGDQWVEPRNARFLTSEVDSDLVRPLDVPSLKFRGLGALLERPQTLRESENPSRPYNSDGKRNFLSATPGQIVASVLLESRARYATMLQGITLAFDASLDSSGAAWGKLDSVAYEPGTDLLRILDDLTSRGLIDWWMQGRALHVVNGDTNAVETDLTVPLLDADSAPVRMTHESRATHVAVEGGQAKVWERPVPGAQVPYGAKVVRIANDSITSEGTAQELIDRQVVQAAGSRREYTTSLQLLEHAPFLDFMVGDWVLARTGSLTANDAGVERVRVHAITIRWDQDAATIGCDLTLNDRFVDASVRNAKRMQGITHGATQVLGDGGVPSRSDRAVPAAPQGVTANSLGYWEGAIPLSSVDVAWQPVETDVDGLALNGVDYYEVRVGGQYKRTTGPSASFDGLQPSRIYDITVRAVSRTGINGRWSGTASVTTAFPLPNLDPPTRPTFRTENGAVEVMWDGKLQGTGTVYSPPRHFAYTLVEVQKVGVAGWTRYERDAGWVLVGLTAGDEWNARLVAVDALGRESQPSPVGQVVVKSAAQEAQKAADAAAAEAIAAKQEAIAAAGRIDTISGELDTTAQQAQDAWNLALEATANASQRVNLAKNPSFTKDAVVDSVQGSATASGGRLVLTATSASSMLVGQFAPASAGEWLAFAVDVFWGTGNVGRARLNVQFHSASGTLGAFNHYVERNDAPSGTRAQFTALAPPGTTQVRVYVWAYQAGGTLRPDPGATLMLDRWQMSPAESEAAANLAVANYFDGDTPDRTDAAGVLYRASWTGEPNASTSIETAYTSAMLEIIAEAHVATEAARVAGDKADAADSEARAARTAALSAAGIAEGKGDFLAQPQAPTAAMRKATTLWIDTTNGANTPKRWNGTAWVAVTDAAAVAAAAAAAAAEAKATEAVNAAGGKNTVFRSVSLPGSTQGRATGDVWWRFADASLEGPIIGQWTWTGSQWRPATIDSQIIANLTVDKLVVTGGAKFPLAVIDTLVGDDAFFSRLMANQVIVSSENMIPGVDTIAHSTAGWEGFGRNLGDPSRWLQGERTVDTTVPFFVVQGVEYTFEMAVRSSVPGTAFYVQPLALDGQDYSSAFYLLRDERVYGTGWNRYETTWVAPASGRIVLRFFGNHRNGAANPSGYQWFREPTMRRRVGSILLKDGIVTSPKVASQAIVTDHLSAGLLDAFQITSPKIQSTAAARRGIKWDGSQFVGFDNSGNEMFRLEGNTGAITGMTITGGRLQTATTGARITITNDTTSQPGIWMYDAGNTARIILGISGGTPMIFFRDGNANELLRIDSGGEISSWAPNGQVGFNLTTQNDGARSRTWLQGPIYGGVRPRLYLGVISLEGILAPVASLSAASGGDDQAYLQVHGAGSWWLGSSTRGRVAMNNASGELYLYPRSQLLSFYNLPTTVATGQPITMIVGSSGMPTIYRQTSLRASKLLIEDLEVDPYRVLELQPRTFYDRRAWEEFADSTEAEWLEEQGEEPAPEVAAFRGRAMPIRVPGLIAEEVEQVIPELASYDGDGQLVGVQYDRVPEYLLLAMRALKKEVDELKEALHG